jgi:FMN-dependent NADH-azoreductase
LMEEYSHEYCFRLDSSIREEGSVTRGIASTLESALVEELDEVTVVRREIGLTPLDSAAWGASVSGLPLPAEERSVEQRAASALAAELGDELIDADALVLTVPLYNFGISQHVKIWVDLLLTDPRFAPGQQPLAGHPAFLVVARGGGYGVGTPREGWDHATGWLNRIFGDVMGLDVQIIESELTLADTTPHMSELRELAATNLREAHHAAHAHGKRLAVELGADSVAA